MAQRSRTIRPEWRTVSLRATANGLTAGERFERFKLEAVTEMVLRVAGILLVMSSMLMWFLLPADPTTGRLASFGAVASLLAAGGLALFAYGTRGFCRRMTLDLASGSLQLTKINMHGQARVSREFKLNRIESVFLRRPTTSSGLASLHVRVMGNEAPTLALSGSTDEIERIHAELCAVMHAQEAPRAARHPSPLRRPVRRKAKLFAA